MIKPKQRQIQSSIFNSLKVFRKSEIAPYFIGECEDRLIDIEFDQLFIYKPGLLQCDREESRPLEFVARKVSTVLDRNRWWSISTQGADVGAYFKILIVKLGVIVVHSQTLKLLKVK